jgi:hypothetical protein
LAEFIVSQLKKGVAPADIIYEICRRTDMRWPEAEAFIRPFVQQLKRRRRPRPVIGLAIFLSLMVAVIAGTIFFVKAALDRVTIAPVVYETAQPYSNLFTVEDRYLHSWSRQRWAEAGQTLVIDYEAAVHAGELEVDVREIWSGGPGKGPYELSKTQQLIRVESGNDQIRIPVTDTGFYELHVRMYGFVGRFDISWDVHSTK